MSQLPQSAPPKVQFESDEEGGEVVTEEEVKPSEFKFAIYYGDRSTLVGFATLDIDDLETIVCTICIAFL